jgi:integrase
MASLQARHARSCKLTRPWTTFADATVKAGCSCTPLYHVVHRVNGTLIREPVGHNRKEAQRALDARRGDVARRTYRVLRDIRFAEWADEWLATATVKPNTRRVYEDSLEYGKRAFGKAKVRDLGTDDVARFLKLIQASHLERQKPKDGEKPVPVSEATLAKHLRQLGACLQAAIPIYAAENPVRLLHKTVRPKPGKTVAVYFTDPELVRLWSELAERPWALALCKTAVGTGMRLGELAALRWDDVDLLNREVRVARTFVEGLGESSPKSGQGRVVDLTPPAAAVLERWYQERLSDDRVFVREDGEQIASGYVLKRVLYPALERAGIPRVGERGRARDFHSFRHTFARVALEGGAPITWVSQQLGHSNITLTVNVYGEWQRSAQKAEAERLAVAFAL